jgi:hypothetical protein
MIATRLHAKRHSGSAVNRPSITSIHNPLHPHIHQQRRKASKRPSEDVQNIDSDVNDDDDDDDIHEGAKVEKFLCVFQIFNISK